VGEVNGQRLDREDVARLYAQYSALLLGYACSLLGDLAAAEDVVSFQEIADALEAPPNTVASRYRYGLAKLREILKPLGVD
jgi:DNA-directed RNA polymerase specialized sigma24 family protein